MMNDPAGILLTMSSVKKLMRKLVLLFSFCACTGVSAQSPCSGGVYRQFDFWLGDWEVYALNGQKAGDSRISLILDSCVVLEEWTSASINRGVRYAGKSFNTYKRSTQQWQQTWVDNVGGSTEYLQGSLQDNKMVFQTMPFRFSKDTLAVRRLSFYNLGPDTVRQHAEISKNDMKTWVTEYDLQYRRKKNQNQ
jgi:hypothetical protein